MPPPVEPDLEALTADAPKVCPPRPPMPDHYRASFYLPESLKKNPGLGLSLGYAILTIFGAGYAAWFYFILNVSFLELTDVADFLVMVFREPLVALFLLLPIPLFSGYMAVMYRAIWWGRWRFPKLLGKVPDPSKPPKYGIATQKALGFIFFFIYAAAFTQFYGLYSAIQLRKGEGHKVTLEMRPIMWPTDAPLRQDVILLGTTARFTIVYDVEQERAWSVPHDSIARILHPMRRSKQRQIEAAAKEAAKLEGENVSSEAAAVDSGTEAPDSPKIPPPPD